jgi:hypothetical protein
LNRSLAGPPRIVPHSKKDAMRWFEQVIVCREQDVVDAHKAALRNLLSANVYELRYSEMTPAIECLEKFILASS